MKKIFSFFALAALCAGFTACDEVEMSDSKPQTNPQEEIMPADGVGVKVAGATAAAVKLGAYSDYGMVPVLDVTKLENFPESYTLGGVMRLSNSADMAGAVEVNLHYVPANVEEAKGDDTNLGALCVSVEDWEDAHLQLYTKNPREVTSYVDFTVMAVNGNAQVVLGESPIGYHEVKVTPLPAKNVIEEAYSLVVNGAVIPMSATNPADVYDPPTFYGSFEVAAGTPVKWAVKSQSGKVYGPAAYDGNPLKGDLTPDGAAAEFAEPGPWLVTVNMEELTFSFKQAIPQLYAYVSSAAQGMELVTNDFVHYNGFLCSRATQKAFFIANSKNKPDLVWGANEKGEMTLGGTSKLKLEEGGCNYLKVNLTDLTFESEHCATFGLIGFWDGWTADVELKPNNTFSVWTGEITITDDDLAKGNEYKIRSNGNWDGINLGGTPDNLVEHADNIVWTAGAGKFALTLDLSVVPYTLKIEAK